MAFKIEKRINGIGPWLPVDTGPLRTVEDANDAMRRAGEAALNERREPLHDFYNVRFRIVEVLGRFGAYHETVGRVLQ